MSYASLVERYVDVEDIGVAGDYQGDYIFRVRERDGGRIGYVVVGYGSCSGCDAYEAALAWDDSEDTPEMDALAESIYNDIRWGTVSELRETFLGVDGQGNNWYYYDKEMRAEFERMFPPEYVPMKDEQNISPYGLPSA
jgi:hypothetical protein